MKISKRVLPLIALGMLSGVSLSAAADMVNGPENYIYLGGGAGYGRINGEDFTNTSGDFTKSKVSWKALAGAKLNNLLSLEGQYIDFGAANRGTDRIQATGWTAGVVVDFLRDRTITPYGKVGALFWDADSRFNNISRNEDGVDVALGVGVRFMFTNHLALRTEYERFEMDSADIDNFSATMQFNF